MAEVGRPKLSLVLVVSSWKICMMMLTTRAAPKCRLPMTQGGVTKATPRLGRRRTTREVPPRPHKTRRPRKRERGVNFSSLNGPNGRPRASVRAVGACFHRQRQRS